MADRPLPLAPQPPASQLELQLERSEQAEAFKRARQERGQRDIDTLFDEYLEWVQETMTTEPQPYIKVVCVMTGNRGTPDRKA
ncbi:MAG: hypothetical protein OXC31_01365 [Spirochaetaceae bacterium]|nr:hypothetical protein [Spirochaetaceae bacterium]